MQQVIILIHILVALTLVGLVLLQQGKGANMGAAFGSGASNTLFGSRGPASFLMKLTGVLLALFFITSLSLGYLASQQAEQNNQLLAPPVPIAVNLPAQPALPQTPVAQNNAQTQPVPEPVSQAPQALNVQASPQPVVVTAHS